MAGILPVQTQSGNPSVSSQLQYNIIQQPYIDETNEEVKDLLDSEMGAIEECIKAIEMYGTASAAVTAMMKIEEKERKEELQLNTDVGALPRSQEQSILHQQAFARLVHCSMVVKVFVTSTSLISYPATYIKVKSTH